MAAGATRGSFGTGSRSSGCAMGFLVASESGRLLGGHLLRVGMRRPDRRGAWGSGGLASALRGVRHPAAVAARALVCARGGGRRQCPRERRGTSSRRVCARQGLPGGRLSNRGVVTSGDGADRVGASDVDGAKSRRRHQPMRHRSSDRNSEARQQPCDGRNDFRHDFPDLLDECLSPASSRLAVQSFLSARLHEQAAGQRADCRADRGRAVAACSRATCRRR